MHFIARTLLTRGDRTPRANARAAFSSLCARASTHPKLVLALLAALIIVSETNVARAERDPLEAARCAYLGAGLGPVIGWSFGEDTRGYGLFGGFEVSGGCPWARLSIGGVYRRAAPGKRSEKLHWLAFEQGLGAGPTAALLHSSDFGIQGGVGGWLGGAFPISRELRQPVANGTITRVCASLALVVRFRFGGGALRTDLFITPKAQYCTHPDFFT
jgi:hypothetical protein